MVSEPTRVPPTLIEKTLHKASRELLDEMRRPGGNGHHARDYGRRLGISTAAASSRARPLIDAGLISRTGHHQSSRWWLVGTVPEKIPTSRVRTVARKRIGTVGSHRGQLVLHGEDGHDYVAKNGVLYRVTLERVR